MTWKEDKEKKKKRKENKCQCIPPRKMTTHFSFYQPNRSVVSFVRCSSVDSIRTYRGVVVVLCRRGGPISTWRTAVPSSWGPVSPLVRKESRSPPSVRREMWALPPLSRAVPCRFWLPSV